MKRFLNFISAIIFFIALFQKAAFGIPVNAAAASPPVITAGPVSGDISACPGSAAAFPQIQQFVVSGNNLTSNIIATVPPGGIFEISLTAAGGYGSSVALTQAGGQVNNIIVYVRSSAVAPIGRFSGKVTLASAGAVSQNVTVTGIVYTTPAVNAVANQTLAAGGATAVVGFTGTGNSYTWVNNTPGIGLAASGTGNIPSFTAVNNGATPLTATITVTPNMATLAYIANVASNNISVINTSTNEVSDTITVNSPAAVAVSPDQSLLYVTNKYSKSVSVIKAATNTIIATIPVGDDPSAIAVSPDGSTVYAANSLGSSVSVINAATNSVTAVDIVGGEPNNIAITPDGSEIYVVNLSTANVTVINTLNNQTIATIPVQYNPNGIAISPDGSKAYVSNQGANTISVISTLTNSVTGTIVIGLPPNGILALGAQPNALILSPDGSTLYVTNEGANTVSVISTATNTITGSIAAGLEPSGLSITPDGSTLYVSDQTSNNVTLINTATNTAIKTIAVGTTPYASPKGIGDYPGCTGSPVTFTITVNSNNAPVITTTMVTGAITACLGLPSASPHIEQFPVSGVRLTANIVATAPVGFEVSLTAVGGYTGSVTLIPSGGKIDNAIVYVRSAASASQLHITGNVVLTSAGAVSQNVAVSGIINPLPAINPVPDQTVNNGSLTTAVNFTGTPGTINWVNNTPGIGLPASGTGNIPAFTAINKTQNPVTATITVTPVLSELAYISNVADRTISMINTATNQVIATTTAGISTATYSGPLGVSPDGSLAYVIYGGSDKVLVVSTSTNSVLATIPVGFYPDGLLVSPDGSRVYVANDVSNNILVIDATTNTVTANIRVGLDPNGDLAITPDGNFLYVTYGHDDFVISVIDTRINSVIANIPATYGYYGLAASPDGTRIYAANFDNNTVSVINTATNTIINTIPVGPPGGYGTIYVTVSPNGSELYVSNDFDNAVYVVDIASGSSIATIKVGNDPSEASLTPDGKQIYVANIGDGTVSVINTATNTVTSTIVVGASPVTVGNIFSAGSGCAGKPETFTITINPGILPPIPGTIVVPNAFTPNGDGINDTWDIKNIDLYPNCAVAVYNRYGEIIYSSTGYGTAWNGTYKGAKLPAGTYYFIINLKNGRSPFSGFVSIIR